MIEMKIIGEVFNMMNEFDVVRDRRKSDSKKWDGLETEYGDSDLLAMWVADMDFDPAKPIRDRLTKVASEHVLGYSQPSEKFYDTYINWQEENQHIKLSEEEILLSPGVVGSIGIAIQAFSEKGDSVLIHDPAYNGFTPIVLDNKRNLLLSPLKLVEGKFQMDFEDIEKQFNENNVKLFILSNPHNPGGRVWTKEELVKLLDLCEQYDVILVSDEIHCDLVYPEYSVTSAYTLDEKYFNRIVVLHSATKTFNIAGVKISTILVKDPVLRERMQEVQSYSVNDTINSFGLVAMEAAFSEGKGWHTNLMQYLESNRQMIIDFFDAELPGVDYMIPESTYLFWFNADSSGYCGEELNEHFVKEGRIALMNGMSYGETCPTWMRLNFGTNKERLQDGLNRIKKAMNSPKVK